MRDGALLRPAVAPPGAAQGFPAPAGLPLRQNFAWTLGSKLVYAATQWGLLVLLTKLTSPLVVGQFALGLAVTAPIILLANLSLRSVQVTDARGDFRFGDYLALRLTTLPLALLVIAAWVLIAGYRWDTTLVILALGLAKACEAVSDVFYGRLQQQERMDTIARSLIVKSVLSLAGFSAGVYLSGRLIWGLVGLVAAWTVVLFAYDIRVVVAQARAAEQPADLRPRWRTRPLLGLAWLAAPLGVTLMLASLNTNLPRYFVEHHLGERELGIFAALAYLVVAGTTMVGALGESAAPRLAKHYAAGDAASFRTLLLKLVAMGGFVGATGVLVALGFGRELLTLVYTPEYAAAVPVFVWIMVAGGVGYMASLLGYGMTAARRFRIQLPLFLLISLTVLSASALLVPRYGLEGAAMALLLGSTVQLLGAAAVIVVALRRHPARAAGGVTVP